MMAKQVPLNTRLVHTAAAQHHEEFLYRVAIIAAALMLLATVLR